MEFNQELIAKVKQCKNSEEILEITKENEIEMTAEEAKAYFEHFNQESGEISDDELDNVAGGACYIKDGRMVVTFGHSCEYVKMVNAAPYAKARCENCMYKVAEKGLWLCNNPKNKE